jgi:hypothetical protein
MLMEAGGNPSEPAQYARLQKMIRSNPTLLPQGVSIEIDAQDVADFD